MKLIHLKALLENYPDDMEVLIVYKDNYREHIEDEFYSHLNGSWRGV